MGDNAACGVSDPEGISGACDTFVTFDGNNPSYYVCTYKEFCKPLGVQPCKTAGTACEVSDKQGTASCQPIFNGAPSQEHQACGNGCADGMMCFIKQDGGTVVTFADGGPQDECLYLCHTPNSATPFDGGLLDDRPGHGGCGDAGETCSFGLAPTDFPAWLSLCGK
jgi:hypothetical protein